MRVEVVMWRWPAVELFELSSRGLWRGLLGFDGVEFRRSLMRDLFPWWRAQEE